MKLDNISRLTCFVITTHTCLHTHKQISTFCYSTLASQDLFKKIWKSGLVNLMCFKGLGVHYGLFSAQVASLTPPTSFLIMEESSQECYAKLKAADVRLLGRGCIPLIPFIWHCTHAKRERGHWGNPHGAISWCTLNAYSSSCRHKCVMLGKPAAEHQTTQKAH